MILLLLILVSPNNYWVQWVNLIMAFLGLATITGNMMARREYLARRVRRVLLWIYGLFLYAAYVSGAAIKSHDSVTYLTFVPMIIFTGVVVSILWHPEGDDKTPPDDGSLGQLILDKLARMCDKVSNILPRGRK